MESFWENSEKIKLRAMEKVHTIKPQTLVFSDSFVWFLSLAM